MRIWNQIAMQFQDIENVRVLCLFQHSNSFVFFFLYAIRQEAPPRNFGYHVYMPFRSLVVGMKVPVSIVHAVELNSPIAIWFLSSDHSTNSFDHFMYLALVAWDCPSLSHCIWYVDKYIHNFFSWLIHHKCPPVGSKNDSARRMWLFLTQENFVHKENQTQIFLINKSFFIYFFVLN